MRGVPDCQPLEGKAGSCKTGCVCKSRQKSGEEKDQSPEVKFFQLEPMQHSIHTTVNTSGGIVKKMGTDFSVGPVVIEKGGTVLN